MIRCSRCRKGPFNEDALYKEIFEYGDVRNPIFYCKTCVSQLRFSLPKEDEIEKLKKSREDEKNYKKKYPPFDNINEENKQKRYPIPSMPIDIKIADIVEEEFKRDFEKEKVFVVEMSDDIEKENESEKIEENNVVSGNVLIEKNGDTLINNIIDEIPKIEEGKYGVFIVRCKDNTLFSGVTKDLEQCIKYMNRGSGNKSIRSKEKRPVKLIYFNQVDTVSAANKKRNELKKEYNF